MTDLQQWLNRQGAAKHRRRTRQGRFHAALLRWLGKDTR